MQNTQPTPAEILDYLERIFEELSHGMENPRYGMDRVGFHAGMRVDWCSHFKVAAFDVAAGPAMLAEMRERITGETAQPAV